MRRGNPSLTIQNTPKSPVLIQEFALTKTVPNSPLSVSQNKQSLIRHIQQLTTESPSKAQKDDPMIRPRTAGNFQSKSFSSDDKFANYIKTIRKSRKTSKTQLKRHIKTLERDGTQPPATANGGLRKGNAPDLLFANEAEKEEGEGYRIVFTKNAKRMMTQRKLTEMKRKIDQVYYEGENNGKVIKYLTNNRLNDYATLMQPKFISTEVKFPPDLSSLKTNTIEDLLNERSSSISNLLTIKSDRMFLKDGHIDMKFKKIVEDEKRKKKNKTFQSNLALYLETKRKEMVAGSIQESPGLPKAEETDQTTEQEQDEEAFSPQERRGTLQTPMPMGKKLSRKTIIELRARTGSVIEDPRKDFTALDEELDTAKTPLFSSVKQLYVDVNSKEFQPEVYNLHARMDPKGQNFTPRYSKTQFPFANKIQALSCTVSKRPSLKELNIGEEAASPQNQQLSPSKLREKMSKEMSAPQSDREVRHKRRSYSKIQEREKFHLKISTVVSTKEAEKKATDFQTQFYNQKLNSMRNITSARTPFSGLTSPKNEDPAQTQNFYQDFQKLKGVCKQNVRRTASIKKNIKHTFAGLHKTLKKMDDIITDRDVKFEARILKDIKQGLK